MSGFDDLLASNNTPESNNIPDDAPARKTRAPRASTASTPKAPGTISAKTAKYANENILPKLLPGYGKEQDRAKAAAQQRIANLQKIYSYYNAFPHVCVMNKKQWDSWSSTADDLQVQGELKRISDTLAMPSAYNNMTFVFKYLCGAVEKASVELFPKMGIYDCDLSGISEELFKDPAFLEPELKELSIVYQDWLTQGPKTRLLIKTMQAYYAIKKARDLEVRLANINLGENRKTVSFASEPLVPPPSNQRNKLSSSK